MAVESCPRCHSRAVNRSGAKRWCASCGRDLPDDDVTTAERAAYERGRADERADVVAWLNAFAKRLDAINEGKFAVRDQVRRDESILVDGCADSIEQRDHVGAAQKKGGAR
jgi:hypothetical protein